MTVNYTINTVKDEGGTVIVSYTLNESSSALTEQRVSVFNALEMYFGVTDSMNDSQKLAQLESNFVLYAKPVLQEFADKAKRIVAINAEKAMLPNETGSFTAQSLVFSGQVDL